MVLIFFENFEKKMFIFRSANPNYNKFEHFSLGDVDALTIKIKKQKFFGRMGAPLKLKFANHFIIYQKRPFRALGLGS